MRGLDIGVSAVWLFSKTEGGWMMFSRVVVFSRCAMMNPWCGRLFRRIIAGPFFAAIPSQLWQGYPVLLETVWSCDVFLLRES